jgi:hypothetical protein
MNPKHKRSKNQRLRVKPLKTADTFKWHGVIGYDQSCKSDPDAGMTIAQLREFLDNADDEARRLGEAIDNQIPLIADYRNGAIRHIWVAICERKEVEDQWQ